MLNVVTTGLSKQCRLLLYHTSWQSLHSVLEPCYQKRLIRCHWYHHTLQADNTQSTGAAIRTDSQVAGTVPLLVVVFAPGILSLGRGTQAGFLCAHPCTDLQGRATVVAQQRPGYSRSLQLPAPVPAPVPTPAHTIHCCLTSWSARTGA